MNEAEVKKYVGKIVDVHYRKPNGETESVQGEVLVVDQGVLCLGVNVANELSGEVIRIVPIGKVVSVEDYDVSVQSSERFLTIGNYCRYCSHLLNGTRFKSFGPSINFYAASEQYLEAIKSGFINDEIVSLYIDTVTNYVSHIWVNRQNHNEDEDEDEYKKRLKDEYKKELEDRIECFSKFRNFLNSDDISFKNLSDHSINKILSKVYTSKSCAYSEKLFQTIYEKYPKESLVSKLDTLLELPKIAGSLLVFAIQMEAMYYLAKAQECSVVKDREALYAKKNELDRLVDQCKTLCQEKLESYQAQDAPKSDFNLNLLVKCGQLSDMIKNVDEYVRVCKEEEDRLNSYNTGGIIKDDLKPLMFSLAFDRIIKELNKIEETRSGNNKKPDKINKQAIKSRYDMCMAQLFNLFEYMALYEKDEDDVKESKWQIALQLIDIYYHKLNLITSDKTQEYSETKSKYTEAIITSILKKLGKGTNKNYFYDCKRTKLIPLSDLLYKFELWDDYILISNVLLDDKANIEKQNKTPLAYKMLCKFRRANIFLKQTELDLFFKEFPDAKLLYDVVLQEQDQSNMKLQRLIDDGYSLYWELYPSFDEKLKKMIDYRRKFKNLERSVESDKFNSSEMLEYKRRFTDLIKDIIDNGDLFIDGDDYNDVTLAVITSINELLPYFGGENNENIPKLQDKKIALSDMRIISANRKKYEGDKENFKKEILEELKIGLFCALQEFKENSKSKDAQKDFISRIDKTKKWFSKEDCAEMLLNVFDDAKKQDPDSLDVAKFIQYYMQRLIDEAERIDILAETSFHTLLQNYCYYSEDYERVNKGAFIKTCLYMAKYPCPEDSIEKRKEFCESGLKKVEETKTSKDKYAKTPQFIKECQELNEVLHELNSTPVTYLDKLRKIHDPKRVVSILNQLFGSPKFIKYIWHYCKEPGDIFKWDDPTKNGINNYATFLEHAKVVVNQYSKKDLPEDLLNDLRLFLSIDKDETSSYGWNHSEWGDWLSANPSLDPNKSQNDFPGYNDIVKFRDRFRCQSSNVLQEKLKSLCKAYWEKHKDILCNYSIELEPTDGNMSVMTWLPRIEKIIISILDDIYKLEGGGLESTDVKRISILIKINIIENSIKIIHKESYANRTAEDFIKKIQSGNGALAEIAQMCLNLVDYAVESKWKDGSALRIPILPKSEAETIPVNADDIEGFTHIIYLYTDDIPDNNKRKPKRK